MKQKRIYLLVCRPTSAVGLPRKPDLLQHIPAGDRELHSIKMTETKLVPESKLRKG